MVPNLFHPVLYFETLAPHPSPWPIFEAKLNEWIWNYRRGRGAVICTCQWYLHHTLNGHEPPNYSLIISRLNRTDSRGKNHTTCILIFCVATHLIPPICRSHSPLGSASSPWRKSPPVGNHGFIEKDDSDITSTARLPLVWRVPVCRVLEVIFTGTKPKPSRTSPYRIQEHFKKFVFFSRSPSRHGAL